MIRTEENPHLSSANQTLSPRKKGMVVFCWSLELKEGKYRAATFCYDQTRSLVLVHIAVSKTEIVKQPLKVL